MMVAVAIAGGLFLAASGAALADDGKGKGGGSQGGGRPPANPYGDLGPTINPNMPPAGGTFQPLCIGQMLSLTAGQITTGGPGGASVDQCAPELDLGLDALLSQIPALAGGSPIPFNDLPMKPGKKGRH
jgi:hypothetical protein